MNLRTHSGSRPDQVPSVWQYLSSLPTSTYPKSHVYTAELPTVVSGEMSTRPLGMSGRGPQSPAMRD